MIKSILDQDLYSFTVQYYYLQKFPRAMGMYEFTDRNNTVYPRGFADKLKLHIKNMETLSITDDEILFMKRKLTYLPIWYTTFLKGYKFDSSEVDVSQDEEGHLKVTIEGLLWKIVMWEVPLLALISELYHQEVGDIVNLDIVNEDAKKKFKKLYENGLTFSDFGTRRRFSFDVQYQVVRAFKNMQEKYEELFVEGNQDFGKFSGTSNVYLAYLFDLTPIGTMSHQIISGMGALFGYKEANFMVMDYWGDVYEGDLGTFLYDTYGWDCFEQSLTKKNALLYSGLRVDSGDNIDQLEKIISKYKELNIDPKTKNVIFSNALDTDKAIKIHNKVNGRIKDSYGIGTHFTCDIQGVKPSNIVIKLTRIKITEKKNWQKAIKLSNDKGKYTGDKAEVQLALKTLGYK